MKRKMYKLRLALIITFANLLICSSIFAQSPLKMSCQAVIRDGGNNLITNHLVGMQISILQGSPTGTPVYVETQTASTNANGLVSIEIGGPAGTVVSGSLYTIDWSIGPYFIKTETDPNGGIIYTITGSSQLLSVPYSLHSKTAESITGGIIETDPVFVTSPSHGITGTNITNWNNNMLPTGTFQQTLYHNGTSWVATNNLLNDGFEVNINKLLVLEPMDAQQGINSWGLISSYIPTGWSPMNITSTTKVDNLNVDLLDDYHAGNATGNVPVSNGTVNTQLNADLLDGYHAGNAFGNIPICSGSTLNWDLNADMLDGYHFGSFALSSHNHDHNTLTNLQLAGTYVIYGHINDIAQTIAGAKTFNTAPSAPSYTSTVATGTSPITATSTTMCTNLNADMTDGYHAGNATGNIPVSNGTVNTNLNADMTDSKHISATATGSTTAAWSNTAANSSFTALSSVAVTYAHYYNFEIIASLELPYYGIAHIVGFENDNHVILSWYASNGDGTMSWGEVKGTEGQSNILFAFGNGSNIIRVKTCASAGDRTLIFETNATISIKTTYR